MKTRPSTFLPFSKSITLILRTYKISLAGERKRIFDGIIDYTIVKRTGLEKNEEKEGEPERNDKRQIVC